MNTAILYGQQTKPYYLINCSFHKKKAIRIITSSRWNTHTAPLFREKCILKICHINVVQVATFMFRYVNNLLPSSFANYFVFNSDIHGYDTRHCNDIHLTYFRTNLRGSCIQINGPNVWNANPVLIKNVKTVHAFKRKFIGTIYKEYK